MNFKASLALQPAPGARPIRPDLQQQTGACEPAGANRSAFLRSWMFVALWPLIAAAVILIVWLVALAEIDRSRVETLARADERVRALADSYEGFVARSIDSSDQLLKLIRDRWSRRPFSLEELKLNGTFPGSESVGASVLDRDGYCLSASFGCAPGKSFAYREYFSYHRDHADDVAYLGPAVAGVNGKPGWRPPVIHLSRRLEDGDGHFAGVATVALLEPYLTAFYDGAGLARHDFVAVVGGDGKMRALRLGGTDLDDAIGAVKPPPGIAGSSGFRRLAAGAWTASPAASLIAWRQIGDFPVYALVGLSEADVLEPWSEARRKILRLAGLLTLLFGSLGIASTWCSSRFVSRRVREQRVRAAYRVATEGTRDGLFFLEPLYGTTGNIVDLCFIDCNEAAAAMLGTQRQALVGQRCTDLLGAAVMEQSVRLFEEVAQKGHIELVQSVCAVGPLVAGILWVEHRIVRTGIGFALTLRDVTDVVVHREQLEQMANEDRLTGLPNRNWLEQRIGQLIQRATDDTGRFAILFVDFDGFKRVNDSMGHPAGDELLRQAAQRLRQHVDGDNCVVRLGGDEFVVLATSGVDDAQLAELAEELVASFVAPFELSQGEIKVGISMGICVYPQHGATMEELLRNADIAMYEEKAARRGRFSFFRPELFSAVKRKFEMEGAILSAIDRNQFVLHFQPQFAVDSGALVGFEALIRWVCPGRGLVLPGEFVPVAEEAGLITRIGEQVIEKACQQLSTWRALELPIVPVSVNVSAIQFHQSDIRGTFERALRRYQIPSEMIQMEITESSMIGNEQAIHEMFQRIRQLGVKIAVDDFGTGYSSLSQLQQLRVDAIKIDRSFISKMVDSGEGEVFVRAIVSMAHALALTVVAEGVETNGQLESLRRLHCEAAQGYLFSKPLAPALATDLLVKVAQASAASARLPRVRVRTQALIGA